MLKETVLAYTSKGSTVFASFLDLSKAFDKVNHFILLLKLIKIKLPPYLVNVLYNMYSNQGVQVYFSGCISDQWTLKNGVRQGAVISPLLFNFYINDVLNNISSLDFGCKLALRMSNIQAYADDLVLLAPTARGLQQLLDRICTELSALNLSLNCDKCSCIIFRSRKSVHQNNPSFYLEKYRLSIVSRYVYLGIVISNNLSITEDVIRCEKSFLRSFNGFWRYFHYIDTGILIYLFKSFCLSFYGSQLWHKKGSLYCMNSISISYHKAIKKILGVSSREGNHRVCGLCNLYTFNHLVNRNIIGFSYKLMKSDSPCIYPYKYFIKNYSAINRDTTELAIRVYDLVSLFDNDFEAIESRIKFVQNREEAFQGFKVFLKPSLLFLLLL